MAVSKYILTLTEDLTCSICLSLFVEPVQLECEHNFCKSCIQAYWENQGKVVSCPECRAVSQQKSYKKARVLANLCEKARQLELNPGLQQEGGSRCLEHDEKLKLFCQDDQALICVICRDSPAHSGHSFLPVADAVRKYKDLLKSALDSMEAEKESKSELKQQQEREIAELDEFTTSLEKDISAQFARIHQYLEDKEKCLTEELMRQKEEDLQLMVGNQSRTEMELFSLEENILNLSEVIQQQDNIYFLKELQGLQEMYLDKGEEGRNADGGQDEEDNDVIQDLEEYVFEEIAYPADEGEEMQLSPRKNYTGFQGPLLYAVWKEMKQIISPFPVSLTLDPNTAHHNLILSEDLTSVRNSETVLELPDNPERFDTAPCVLGSQGFNSGKHYWEVEVGDNTDWDVGVVREFANRKGCVTLSPENGYWAVWLRNENEYGAAIDSLCPSVKPRSIGVYLDYEGGLVTFYNADDMSVLYTFTDTFTENLFPYFYPGLHNVGKKDAPLKLCCF